MRRLISENIILSVKINIRIYIILSITGDVCLSLNIVLLFHEYRLWRRSGTSDMLNPKAQKIIGY